MLKVKTLEISKRKSFLLFWYFAWSTHLGCFHIFTRLLAEDLAVVNGDARPLEHHGQWRGEGQVWTPYQVRNLILSGEKPHLIRWEKPHLIRWKTSPLIISPYVQISYHLSTPQSFIIDRTIIQKIYLAHDGNFSKCFEIKYGEMSFV